MRYLGNIRVGNKLLVILLLNVLLLVLLGGAALFGAKNINQHLKTLYQRDFMGMVSLLEADRDLHQSLLAERTLMFATPGSDEFATQLEDYATNKKQADTRVDKYAATTSDPDQLKLVEQYHAGRKLWDEVSLALVEARQQGQDSAALRLHSLVEGKKRFDTMRDNLDQITEILYVQAESQEHQAEKVVVLLVAAVSGLTLFSIVLGALFTLLVTRNITAPLARILDVTEHLARGEFPQPLDLRRRDELGRLSQAFDTMNQTLQDNMRQIEAKTKEAEEKAETAQVAVREAEAARAQAETAKREGMLQAAGELEVIVAQIGSASEELNAQIKGSRQGSELQRTRTTEGATAMEEMTSAVLEVARNASGAAEYADKAKEKAEAGGKAVGDVVAAIAQLNQETTHLNRGMTELDNQAKSIGEVMTVISDIADQTNLLALNAAIEAARAGDSGRGFAVVADEVRKLAEKTMHATQEVGQAIEAIQRQSRESIGSMAKTASTVATSTGLASEAGGALNEIIALIESTADQVRAIATASEQQSATSEEINRGSDEINRIAGENAENMAQSAEAMEEIARLSSELERVMKGLKGEESPAPDAEAEAEPAPEPEPVPGQEQETPEIGPA